MKDYDVVVIGAGLGGLSAATSLARAGKKVLLLEKHNVPGGYASSFTRGRFEFEIALHELSGLGNESNKGPVWRMLNEYGIIPKVEFIPIPDFYRAVLPDVDITVPLGRQNFEEVLCNHFPKDTEGIKRFSTTMFNFAEETLRANRVGMKAVMEDPSKFPTLMANFGRTLTEVLNPEISDERARTVLSETCGYYCQPPSKMSFRIYALGTVSYLRFGPAHIKGKSQALSQAFVDVIEECGGEVWLNNGAARILTSDGKVRGVVAEDGTEVACSYVVCNANPLMTCLNLIGRENVPNWYLRRLGAWSAGASTFNVYLGLDCTCAKLGLRTHENFVNVGTDLDKQHESMRHSISLEPYGTAVTAYNVVDEEFSPPGTASVVLTILAYAEPWLKLSPSEYVEAKDKLAEKVIGLAERVAPGLRNHIEVMEIATPVTNVRYTGNPGGSIIGFDENYQGTGQTHLPNRGPLEGLYFAGAWVNIGGGFETCIVSGYMAARDAMVDMERGGRDVAVMEKLESQLTKQAEGAPELKEVLLAQAKKTMAKLHPDRISLKVKEIIKETPSTKTLRLVPVDGALPYFRAGQYINLFVNIDGVLTSRPYSISSAPGKPYYDITVRRMEGGFVSRYLMDRVKPGDTFESTGPNGSFYYEPLIDASDLVFLAGGSGITPFISIIREVTQKQLPVNIHLLYGSRSPSDIIFEGELKELAKKHGNVKVDFVISEPPGGWSGLCGLLDARMISSLVGSVDGKKFFLCGPAQMHVLCDGALKTLGVPLRRIKKEAYGPPADVTSEPGWPGLSPNTEFKVVEERSSRALKAKAGEPLMISLERAGLVVPAICRSGECTACRTRLVAGKVFAPARVQRRWVDEKAGYIHPCMSYPLENLRIRL